MDGHSPVSTLLGCSPPPFLSLGEKAENVCDFSREISRSSPSPGASDDSGTGEAFGQRIIKTRKGPIPPPPSSSLAARRARVLGANVATVDASLPAIVAGRGCCLFAELLEGDDEEEEPGEEESLGGASAGSDRSGAAGTGAVPEKEKEKKKKLVRYLDAQNNVPAVGHSHPAVAAAVSRAFSRLNTNSRYLHPDLVEHAEQLAELLSSPSPSPTSSSLSPPPSSSSSSSSSSFIDDPVVYYVPSGTEANDLALRIARAFHEEAAEAAAKSHQKGEGRERLGDEAEAEEGGPQQHRHHYLALEGAYHGHAGEPARVSSYIHFGGAVGTPCPADVSLLRLPDSVRDAGLPGGAPAPPDPAAAVRAAARRAREGRGASASSLTAFIFESFPSCAGQVVLPRGWLRAAVAEARRDAAERRGPPPVVIADEVQTGLGRLGPLEANSFWAFQHFGVPSPDIVTIGKPAANGFPFGAVVASRRVAAAFAGRHPPFFSTFGGCTAAAAAALATLGALRQERLPERAAEVGAWLLAELKRMAAALLLEEGDGRNERIRRSKLIIDVRGVGLMLGVEVAFGKERSFAAAPRVAAFVAAHCRDASRVLISCDGAGPRAGSVLKIKPPLCFDLADAEELVGALRAGFEAVPAELLLLP